ncbi:MAG: hypothetical protein HUU32_18560 [Calditrichaceae bacterium]|nr:hypothetical protein [Calditrichia bacterium]NUQ43396.1 hypothetical protein [Calditrichaceae bacterium]
MNRSIEEVLESTLNTALPELEDAPAELAAEMAKLPELSDSQLWQVARRQMEVARETLLYDLLDAQAERSLTSEEVRQLEELRHQAGRIMVLKSQAYALLHQRGYPVPQP